VTIALTEGRIGGGAFNASGTFSLEACRFAENSGFSGGAVFQVKAPKACLACHPSSGRCAQHVGGGGGGQRRQVKTGYLRKGVMMQ
jgi:hypothetical protein